MKFTFRLAIFVFALFFLTNTVTVAGIVVHEYQSGKLLEQPSKVLQKHIGDSQMVPSGIKVKTNLAESFPECRNVELLRTIHFDRSHDLYSVTAAEIYVVNPLFVTSFTKAP